MRVTIAGRTYDGYPERIPVNGVAPKAQGWAGELERLGAVRAMKASFVTYPLISAIHVLSIATLVSCVILLDLRLLGRFAGLPQAELVPVLRQIVLSAFGFAIITGLLMFSVRANTYIKNEAILDKNAVDPACGIELRYIYMA